MGGSVFGLDKGGRLTVTEYEGTFWEYGDGLCSDGSGFVCVYKSVKIH